MASYKYRLPVEQWRQVLMNNSPRDLCNVVMVSRHMYSVASLPELWAGMKVNMRKVNENGLKELYNIKRFKKVKQIKLDYFDYFECEDLERLLKEIPGSPIESANMFCQRLSRVSAELLASAVSHLHIANLRGTNLTNDQCVSLLTASLSSTTLSNVNLNYVNLSKVPSHLLANSISRLQGVELCATCITTDQCIALLKASLSSVTLKSVNLEEINLSEVPSDLLANSISRLQRVNLRATRVTTDQCLALLKANVSSTTLTYVNLDGVDLSKVLAELLANSISRLHDVNLYLTGLTTNQCVALLKAILYSATLRKVNLGRVDLSKVPSELLANSISRLQEVRLIGTFLTSDQCVALLKASHSSSTLHRIDLDCNIITRKIPSDKQYLLTTLQAHMNKNKICL